MRDASFEGCVFLGLSVDNFIARADNDLAWLVSRGAEAGEAGFDQFVQSIDALVMGRGTYDFIAGEAQWPYLGKPVHVLSTTLEPGADERITVHGSFDDAVEAVTSAGYRRIYIDGGQTFRAFLAAGLVHELTLSHVPVLLGEGIGLFGPVGGDVDLEHVRTEVLGGGMVQTTYRVVSGPNPIEPAARR